MNIYIKSFNRPYFLDRCLATVYEKISGFDEIIILDDGTPARYLEKIAEKYPKVRIRTSEFYHEKSEMMASGQVDRSKLKFPGEFWHRECSAGSEFFLLLEDDMFVVEPISLQEIEAMMREHSLSLFKCLWLSSERLNQGEIEEKGAYDLVKAPRQYSSKSFQHIVENPPLFARLMNKLTGKDYYFSKYILPYYTYYFVAGGVYHRPYFDYLWKGVQNLGEKVQIRRTLEYYEARNQPIQVGKTKRECLKTSFLSSATNEFPNVDFSIFALNRIINEAWYRGDFDVMNNYPEDYPVEMFLAQLPESTHGAYIQWITEFKKPFLSFGCRV